MIGCVQVCLYVCTRSFSHVLLCVLLQIFFLVLTFSLLYVFVLMQIESEGEWNKHRTIFAYSYYVGNSGKPNPLLKGPANISLYLKYKMAYANPLNAFNIFFICCGLRSGYKGKSILFLFHFLCCVNFLSVFRHFAHYMAGIAVIFTKIIMLQRSLFELLLVKM